MVIDLLIPAEEYLSIYRGSIRDVFCYSRDGRSIRFPAKILQPFVKHDGIHGSFCINFDAEGKFKSINELVA